MKTILTKTLLQEDDHMWLKSHLKWKEMPERCVQIIEAF